MLYDGHVKQIAFPTFKVYLSVAKEFTKNIPNVPCLFKPKSHVCRSHTPTSG